MDNTTASPPEVLAYFPWHLKSSQSEDDEAFESDDEGTILWDYLERINDLFV